MNPIICIGNYHFDKKIKELMKVCNAIELKTPTPIQMTSIIKNIMPSIEEPLYKTIIDFVQSDLRKLNTIYSMYQNKHSILKITQAYLF